MNEQALIDRILNGDKDAFRVIVEKYQSMVFRVSMGFVHDKAAADDLSQEVFVNAYLSLYKFRGKSNLSTWLFRITINASLNYLRTRQQRGIFQNFTDFTRTNRQKESIPETSNDPGPDQQLMDKQKARQIRIAIQSLPEKQRIAFVLSKYNDLSQMEIADIMKTSEGAVEQLLQRAKGNLRKKLQEFK